MYTCIQLYIQSLVGQYEYKTQSKGSFWCHVIDTKGAIFISDTLK